jgi:CheY-like chemotaxis protein
VAPIAIAETHSPRVLVIDDSVRTVIRYLLESFGYTCETAPDGRSGLARFDEGASATSGLIDRTTFTTAVAFARVCCACSGPSAAISAARPMSSVIGMKPGGSAASSDLKPVMTSTTSWPTSFGTPACVNVELLVELAQPLAGSLRERANLAGTRVVGHRPLLLGSSSSKGVVGESREDGPFGGDS